MDTVDTSLLIDALVNDFHNGKLVAITDGSFYNDAPIGAVEWTLTPAEDSEYILVSGLCLGSSTSQLNAYSSELWDFLGIFAVLWALEQSIGPVMMDMVEIGCDGMVALSPSLMQPPRKHDIKRLTF